MKFRKWILTDSGEKLFYNSKSGCYERITLSNERINKVIQEAIDEFNLKNDFEIEEKYINSNKTVYDEYMLSMDNSDDLNIDLNSILNYE